MKSLMIKLVIAALLGAIIAACSSGGGLAGIGGSGYISTGTVTGFGSVFVNGVEFETGSAVFDVEDSNGSQDDLRIGMVVQVAGSINADGVTGTATQIRYGDDIEGPVSSIVEDINNNIKTFSIFGVPVVVKAKDTVFNGLTYGSLLNDYVIEVSGYYDDQNVLQASYVEFKSSGYDANTEFEVSGVITGLSGNNFMVRGVSVNAASANLSDLPNGLQNGIHVEVKGVYSTGVIFASEVELEDDELADDGREVSVEGYITRYVSDDDFDINGYPVNASSAQFEPASLVLRAGLKVEAEGTVSNGVLNASEVETRGGDAEVSAYVESVDIANNRIYVKVVDGQPSVIVQLTTATLTEDDVGSNDHLLLSDLVANNFVEVRGYETGVSTITATRVKRKDPDNIELQGVVTAQQEDVSVTVLGVIFPVDVFSSDPTEYEDENDDPYANHLELINNTTINQTVLSIEDKAPPDGNSLGVADSVEIEIP